MSERGDEKGVSEAVVVFGKTAEPGAVKTRLSPPLTPAKAAEFYRAFARDVMVTVERYCSRRAEAGADIAAVLAWDGEPSDRLATTARQRLGFEVVGQGTGDLGERLRRTVRMLRERGVEKVLVVGTDSPTLSVEHLDTARLSLRGADVVFGPSFDGGYYLIGLDEASKTGLAPEDVVFDRIDWSTASVLEQSWARASEQGLLCDLLGFWYDVDTFEDLKKLRFHLCEFLASRDPLVSQYTRCALEQNPLEKWSR